MARLSALYQGTVLGTIFGPSFGILILGATFFFVKWCVARTIDGWYVIGYNVPPSTQLSMIQFARTRVWDQVASFMLR